MRQDVIARQVAAMRAANLDAIVSISPENFSYVTGFLSPTQPIMRWRHAMVLVTADGATALIVVDMEAHTIHAKAPTGTDIAVWREFKFDAMSVLADLLRQRSLAKAHIGIEMDLAAALTRGIYEQGAEYFKLMIVATGERSVFPNVGPTERILKRGDVCRVEIFPMIGGYHAGVCRTAAVEPPPPHAERIWANLTACKYLLLDAIKPGASSRAIYELYLSKFGELGLPPISFIGHGIGLHLHEDPYLGPTQDQPLEAGMVLGIEPLVYETGFGFGMQNKDMLLVTGNGCELLSDYANTDKLLIVA